MASSPLPSPGSPAPLDNITTNDLENIIASTQNIYVKGVRRCPCFVDTTFTYYKGTYKEHDESAPIMTATIPFPSIMQIIGCAQTSDVVCPVESKASSGTGKLVSPPGQCPVMVGAYPWLVFNDQRYVGKFTFGFSCLKCEKIIKDHLDNEVFSEDECCLVACFLQCYRNCCRLPIICPRIHLRTYKSKSTGEEAFSVYRVSPYSDLYRSGPA